MGEVVTRPSSVLAASDLDQTLIFSARSAQRDVDELICLELYRGDPISFVTPTAWHTLAELVTTGRFLPVTTRTPEQYLRIRWPGRPPRTAVCSNGGVVLRDGIPDPGWGRLVRDRLAQVRPVGDVMDLLRRLAAELQAVTPGSEPAAVREVPGLFGYVVLREGQRPALEGTRLGELTAVLDGWGWTVSLQGRKLYAVPRELTKSAAVQWVTSILGCTEFVAAGDSLLDVDLLTAASASRRPRHGELFATGWTHPGSDLTDTPGAGAGEEIATWLLTALTPVIGHEFGDRG